MAFDICIKLQDGAYQDSAVRQVNTHQNRNSVEAKVFFFVQLLYS